MPDLPPQPVYYLCFAEQPGIPEQLRRQCVRVYCSHCDRALIAYGPTFRVAQRAALLAGRRLLVVCGAAPRPMQAVPDV